MRVYDSNMTRVLYCLSLAALAGCFSKGATPPGANASCKTNDGCPSGYQCLPATAGSAGLFCCKDKNNCGPAGSADAGGLASGGGTSGKLDGAIQSGGLAADRAVTAEMEAILEAAAASETEAALETAAASEAAARSWLATLEPTFHNHLLT